MYFCPATTLMKKEFKILLADDHSVVRHGMSLILRSVFKNLEIFQAKDIPSALSSLAENAQDLILLDINLPGGNTTQMIERLRTIHPQVKVLMFSAFEEEHYALRYIHAGANGFVKKDSSDEEIIQAIRTVVETGSYVSARVKEKILEAALNKIPVNPLAALSAREIEVALLLAKGEGNLEIANQLNIQMTTVSTYKNRVFEKLKINNVVSLVEMFKIYEN